MAEFNLIDEPWIPCIDLHGQRVEYGIHDTLFKAHDLSEICDDSPLVTVAIHRLLLALLYRAFDGPSETSEWKALYRERSFEANGRLTDYLTKRHDRFFLFDDTHPFMQVAGLDLNEYNADGTVKTDKTDGLMRLAREAPDKGGRILFDHRMGTERRGYERKQIAKMILAAQSYSGTGVASRGKVGTQEIKPTACEFGPCVDGLCLWLQGDNLFQTLVLNLVPQEVCPTDLPAWEDDNIVKSAIGSWSGAVSFTGPVQRYAPLSRLIRALDKTSAFFTNGLKTSADSDDPMKAYYRESDTEPYMALKLLEHKAAWRDAHTLFAVGVANRKPPASLNFAARIARDGMIDSGAQFRANVIGLATKQGKVLLWRHERMPVSPSQLNNPSYVERLEGLLKEADAIGALLSAGLSRSSAMKKPTRSEPVGRVQQIADLIVSPSLEVRAEGVLRREDGRAPQDAHNKSALDLSENLDPRPAYWARLEKHFLALLENLPNDWDETSNGWKPDGQQNATRTWRDQVKSEAQRALEESIRSLGTTARVIQAVARVRRDFSDDDLKPRPQKEAKARGREKGGRNRK